MGKVRWLPHTPSPSHSNLSFQLSLSLSLSLLLFLSDVENTDRRDAGLKNVDCADLNEATDSFQKPVGLLLLRHKKTEPLKNLLSSFTQR